MGFIWAIVFMFGGLLLSVVIGTILLNNPFQLMLEGKGLLTGTLDSTGIIKWFIVGLQKPYVRGMVDDGEVTDVFNRDAVFMMSPPQKAEKPAEVKEDGGLTINLTEKEVNTSRFGMWQYPVFLWNGQNKTMITKDFLAKHESDMMARHNIIFLNRKVEQLSEDVKNFARHVVELHRKGKPKLTAGWIIIIVIVLLAVLAWLFAPALIDAFSGVYGTVNNAVN